jgi:hypothetical protein
MRPNECVLLFSSEVTDLINQTAANMTLNLILQNVRTLRSFGREEALVQAWVENKIKVTYQSTTSLHEGQNRSLFKTPFIAI